MDIRYLGCFRNARIHDHKEFIRVLAKFGEHTTRLRCMMAHHGVPPNGKKHICFIEVRCGLKTLVAIGFSIGPISAGQLLSQSVIKILRTQTSKHINGKDTLRYTTDCTAPHKGKRTRSVFVYYGGEFFGYFIYSLVPGYFLKCVPYFFQGMHEPVGMVLVINDIKPFPAGITLSARIVLISTYLDYTIVFDPDFKATEICT